MPDESALENQEQSTPKPESPRAISAESSARTSPRASESFRRLTRFLGNYAEVKEKGVRRALGVEDRRESGKLIDSSSNTEPAPTSTKETPFPEKLSATDRLRRFVRNYLTVKREESLRKKFGLPEESIGTEGERLSKKYGWSKESSELEDGSASSETSQEPSTETQTTGKEHEKDESDYQKALKKTLEIFNERIIKSIHAQPLTLEQLDAMDQFSMTAYCEELRDRHIEGYRIGRKWKLVFDKSPIKAL